MAASDEPLPDMTPRNADVIEEFRLHQGRVGGVMEGWPLVLITHTGRHTGRRITTPLVYSDCGGHIVVVASDSGADVDPSWFLNIQADPRIHVERGVSEYDTVARIAQGAEREALYASHAAQHPDFLVLMERTDRVFPVVVVSPGGTP